MKRTFQSLRLDMPIVTNKDASQKKKQNKKKKKKKLDGQTTYILIRCELFHLHQHCLQMYLFKSAGMKELTYLSLSIVCADMPYRKLKSSVMFCTNMIYYGNTSSTAPVICIMAYCILCLLSFT